MPSMIAEHVRETYTGSHKASRVGLSDFSHGRKWRDDLAEAVVLEIVDRTETAGWLLSDEGMGSLVERIESLEAELEQARLSAIFEARAHRESWAQGEQLASAAKASGRARRKEIEEATRDGQ